MDVAELLQLVQRGVIDTRHITTRYFPLTAVNDEKYGVEEAEKKNAEYDRLMQQLFVGTKISQ